MREFIEVTEYGEWNEDNQDYDFEEVGTPTFFAMDQIQWFQPHKEYIVFGIIGYETAFKADIPSYPQKVTDFFEQDVMYNDRQTIPLSCQDRAAENSRGRCETDRISQNVQL